LEEVFPHALPIAHDGFGNCWIVDVTGEGWGGVYYVCHDPPVVVFQLPDVEAFLVEVGRFREPGRRNEIDQVHDEHASDLWRRAGAGIPRAEAFASNDPEMRAFAASLPEGAALVDLRSARTGQGFAWSRGGSHPRWVRKGARPLWARLPDEPKRGLLARLLG